MFGVNLYSVLPVLRRRYRTAPRRVAGLTAYIPIMEKAIRQSLPKDTGLLQKSLDVSIVQGNIIQVDIRTPYADILNKAGKHKGYFRKALYKGVLQVKWLGVILLLISINTNRHGHLRARFVVR